MLRIPQILTRAKDKRQAVLSHNLTQKIILTLLVAALATVPLWLGLARVHSAPSNVASPPVLQPPAVVLNVPSEVLIGEDFEFEVRLKNNPGNPIGYAPYVELYLPASGVDGNSASLKCDGITFLSARALFTSPPSLTLPVALDSGMDTSPNPCPKSYGTHPFTGATIFTPPLQYSPTPIPQYQLVVIPLPFGSFDPTQPENIIKVKARLSDYADAGMPLTIYAKGGFRYGTDEKDNHPSDPLVESAPISAQTTPTLFKIKKEYLGPEDEAVSGPNFVNYYPLKYKVTVDIANGQLIQNLVVTDQLPANLQFNGNVQVTIQGNNANVVTSCSATPGPFDVVIASPPSTPGTLSVTLCSSLTGSATPDDVVVTFDFFIPDVDANGQIIISKDCSNAPVAVKNDILAAGDWDPLDPRDAPPNTTVPVNSNLTNVDHILNAKCLAIQKSVKMFQEFPGGAIGPTPGDVLRYELNFQVSDYFSIGNLVVTDFLADGQTFLGGPPPTLRVTDLFGNTGAPTAFPPVSVTTTLNQPVPAGFCPTPLQLPQVGTIVKFNVSLAMLILPPFIPRHDAGMLTGGLAAGPPTSTPATGTIVFYAKINDAFNPPVSALHKFVDKHDPINNCVSIKGTVYSNSPRPTPLNAVLNIPTSIIGSAVDGSAVQTTIVGADLVKTVWAVRRGTTTLCGPATINATSTSCLNLPNAPEEVRPGDRVTFRLEKPFPSGDSEAVKIEDWLPLPIFKVASGNSFNNFACAGLPGPGISCLGPTDTLHTLVAPAKPVFIPDVPTNSITFDYKDFNNTANTSLKIDLLFTYTVTNQPFADGLFMTNEARECEDNSFGVTFCQVSIAQVKVREPNLRIRKGVIATNNPNGQFSQPGPPPTANLATAQAPPNAALTLAGISQILNSSAMVNSNDLATGILDSNLPGGVDANDTVTFAITIENQGGHPAYDAKLEEKLPACFTNLSNIVVKRGTGAVVNPLLYTLLPLANGFTITSIPGAPINAYHPTNGANIIVITFQAKLKADVSPGCCDNVAELQQYASKPGGLNFVTAGFTPPFQDPAQVCVKPKAEKCVVATSEVHTQADNSVSGTPQPPQVTIGEIIRYHLTVTLPEGVSPFFKLTDHLPPGLTYMPGTAKIAFVSTLGITSTAAGLAGAQMPDPVNYTLGCLKPNPTVLIPPTLVSPNSFTPGDDPTFGLGILTNNDNDSNLEYVVIEFNALVNNIPTNFDTVPLKNNYDIFLGKVVLGQTQVAVATSNDSYVTIVEPNFTMTKTVAPNPAVKGQTLTYTVQYTNNGTADAFNVELKDTLPPGLYLGTVAAGCPFTNVPLNTLTVTCAQIPKAPNPGSTVIVTYQAVANPATCPVTLNNQAKLTWTSLPGLQGTTVNPTGSSTPGNSGAADGERDGVTPLLTLNDYATTASAGVKIDCPCEAMITGMKFNDLNGNGVRDTGEPGLANWTIQVTNSTGNTQTTTTDSAGNYSLTVPAPGTYTVAEVLQSGWAQTAPTTGTYSVTVSPGQVITNFNFGNQKKIQNKCDLQITKEVKPNPLVSGQQATAILTVKNVGTGPCHGPTQVAESMPAGLTLVSATVPGGSCVLSTGVCNYAPAIPAGGSVVFTYVFNVTAQPGATLDNCARLINSEDTNPTNNGTCVPLTVSDAMLPDLTIQKKVQCGGPAIPQGTCNAVLTITNNGPGSFNGSLVVQDLVTPPPSPALSLIGSSSGWSCNTGPPNNIGCYTNSSVSLAPGQSTTLSLLVKIPDGQFKNCASVKGYKTPESNFNNNESCVSMDGSVSSDCTTPPANMVSWWPGDGNANDILDGNQGASVNGATYATGLVGQAFSFAGPGDYIKVPDSTNLDITGQITMDAWIKTSGTSDYSGIVGKILPDEPRSGYLMTVAPDSKVRCDIIKARPPQGTVVSTTLVGNGNWHHVACTYDGAVVKLYVNGNLEGSVAYTDGIGLTNEPLLIGRDPHSAPARDFTGLIDEVEIFNRSLSQSEIQSIFKARSAGKCKSTPSTGKVIIRKNTVGGDNTFGYTTGAGLTAFSITTSGGTGSQTFSNIAPGPTTVTESLPPPGWAFTSLECSDPDGGTTVSGKTANIDLDPGETVICTYINTKCPTVPLRLFNTGVADNGSLLASGATDPHYVLLNTSPVFPNALVLFPNQVGGYLANSATSQWLGPDPPGSNGGQGGFYTYRTTFNLDCDSSTAVISGQWSTDNEAEIFLNGSPTGLTTGPSDFIAFKPFVITSGFISGVNTLDFRVRNRLSSQGSRTPTGMQVQMNGTVKCCRATGSLTVTKTVENLSPSPTPAGTSFSVTVSCLPSGPNVTLNLAAGGTQTVNNIPVGSKCTVTEGPLPGHISSPVCESLQWSAPTYSPAQSVTISNSGAPQMITIKNRLVCLFHQVDTYAFTPGMNEFCIWGGGGSGSYNSPNLIGNTDSPLFNSPALTGNTGGVRFGAIGLCYGRILSANGKFAFKYTFNALPAAVLSYPDVNPVLIDRPFVSPVSTTRRNVFGGGLSPIGFQLYFRPQSRIKPFVNTSAGFIFFKDQVPRLNGAQFNFTYDFGGGVQVFRDSRRAFTLGYKYQRLSNGGRAPNSPGFDGNVFYLGYSIFK